MSFTKGFASSVVSAVILSMTLPSLAMAVDTQNTIKNAFIYSDEGRQIQSRMHEVVTSWGDLKTSKFLKSIDKLAAKLERKLGNTSDEKFELRKASAINKINDIGLKKLNEDVALKQEPETESLAADVRTLVGEYGINNSDEKVATNVISKATRQNSIEALAKVRNAIASLKLKTNISADDDYELTIILGIIITVAVVAALYCLFAFFVTAIATATGIAIIPAAMWFFFNLIFWQY